MIGRLCVLLFPLFAFACGWYVAPKTTAPAATAIYIAADIDGNVIGGGIDCVKMHRGGCLREIIYYDVVRGTFISMTIEPTWVDRGEVVERFSSKKVETI